MIRSFHAHGERFSFMSTPCAVLLAAGLGTRLEPVSGGLPKCLVAVGGRSILSRSLDTLRTSGVESITVVVGYRGESVADEARRLHPGIAVVVNPDPSGTGSMRSLALGWRSIGDSDASDVLVVEGDVVYPPRAVEALLANGSDRVLASGPTGAGDEVWLLGRGDRILEIAKAPSSGHTVLGELVGLSLLSASTLRAMVDGHAAGGEGTAMEHYEERLGVVAEGRSVLVQLEADLPWAEVDDARQLARAESEVIPRLEATSS